MRNFSSLNLSWKQMWILSFAKNTSHWTFFNIIVQSWVIFKPMVLKGRFLCPINSFREFKRLWWLVWLIIHDYFRHGVTTSTLDLFNRTMVIFVAAVAACHVVWRKNQFVLVWYLTSSAVVPQRCRACFGAMLHILEFGIIFCCLISPRLY